MNAKQRKAFIHLQVCLRLALIRLLPSFSSPLQWGIIPFTILITFASILPKLVSGVPLRELHAAATSDNLKGEGIVGQIAPVFNNNIELWAGRAAMMGLTTLVLIEAVKGEAFF